jgi:two-component system chemotaxis response regulator CheB
MPNHDIIVVGASAGGIEVLRELVAGLPAGLPASLLVVCHVQPGARSILPEILSRAGPLLARHAGDGEPIYPGHIYVAPPDDHLLVGRGVMRLDHGPRENRHRPAIDPLFRSAARAYGPRVAGVILTGYLDDGAAGLLAIRAAGGVAVVQDPADAMVGADHVVAGRQLPALLTALVQRPWAAGSPSALAGKASRPRRGRSVSCRAPRRPHPAIPAAATARAPAPGRRSSAQSLKRGDR